jgi:hypothetical protein
MVGRERGQGQLGFTGELPENGDEQEGPGGYSGRSSGVKNGWVGVA